MDSSVYARRSIVRILILAGLAGGFATAGQAQVGTRQTTTRVVGDTLLVQCHPETVATKRRKPPVRPRKRKAVTQVAKAAPVVPGDTSMHGALDSVKATKPPVKKHHRRRIHRPVPPGAPQTVVTKKIIKTPLGPKVIQVCTDIKLPKGPQVRSSLVPAWAQALAPVEGPPLPGAPERLLIAEEGGTLPPSINSIQSGPVTGSASVLRGGGIALIPAIFVAFLNDHGGNHSSTPADTLIFPINPPFFPPEIPPVSTVPEPSSLALLSTGLLALGGIIRRRKR